MNRLRLLIITTLFPILTVAQGGIEIVPFAGFMFGGSVNFYQGKLNITDGLDYGVSLIIPIKDVVDIELNYTGMQSEGQFTVNPGYPDLQNDNTGMSSNYFQIGVLKSLSINNSKIKPFGSFSMGATLFSLKEFTDTWRFSIIAGLGVTFMLSDHFGIMVRGRFMMPMYFGSGGTYSGIGKSSSNYSLSINGYAQPLQGAFSGGIVIKIGN